MIASVPVRPDSLESLFSPEQTHYYRLPARCRRSDYDDVLARYVERVRRVPGVVGVARFGNVSVPGISDLDLVVVTEPELGPGAGKLLSVSELPEFDREIMLHDPTIVSEDRLAHLTDHLELPQLVPVWGRVPAIPAVAADNDRWRRLSILLEWLPGFQQYFADLSLLRRVDVRWHLPILHSMRYTTALANDLLGVGNKAWTLFLDEVEQLRREWFDLPNDAERRRRAAVVTVQGWRVIAEVCFEVETALRREQVLPSLQDLPDWIVWAMDRYFLMACVRVTAPDQFIHGTKVLNRASGVLRLLPSRLRGRFTSYRWALMPPFHFAHTWAVTGNGVLVHGQFRERWVKGPAAAPLHPRSEFESYLAASGRRLEEYAHYLRKNGLAVGSACSGFLYDPKSEPTCPHALPARVRRAVEIHLKRPAVRRALPRR